MLISLAIINKLDTTGQNYSLSFSSDSLSSPLLILTTWLLPLIIIASQHHLNNETETQKNIYCSYNSPSNLPNNNFLCYRNNDILYLIWNSFNSYSNYYFPMRKPNRTYKSGLMLFILHINRVFSSTDCPNAPAKSPRLPKLLLIIIARYPSQLDLPI